MSTNQKFYACINKNSDVRQKSSSGGVYYNLAKAVIDKGGVAFGARFNENWQIVHDYCDNLDDLIPFLGSKYVQSKMGDSFKKAKEYLDSSRIVLFCGTPCQIAGLKNFLKKDYENLITADFACHGVACPGVWEEFLKIVSNGKIIKSISFRDKTEGWSTFSLKIAFTDGTEYRKICYEETFMKGFLQNVYLRPSCYECNFKGLERPCDFTIADFWGVNTAMPQMYDNKGTSLIVLHTQKAQNMWEEIKDNFKYMETQSDTLIAANSSMVKSVALTPKREQFYSDTKTPLIKKIEKLTTVTFTQKVKRKIKSILHV